MESVWSVDVLLEFGFVLVHVVPVTFALLKEDIRILEGFGSPVRPFLIRGIRLQCQQVLDFRVLLVCKQDGLFVPRSQEFVTVLCELFDSSIYAGIGFSLSVPSGSCAVVVASTVLSTLISGLGGGALTSGVSVRGVASPALPDGGGGCPFRGSMGSRLTSVLSIAGGMRACALFSLCGSSV